MRTIKKGTLPREIEINGTTLKMYAAASVLANMNARHRAEELQAQGLTVCIVEVHNRRLKGKTDLHGQPYKHSTFIFSDLSTPEQIAAWRDRVEFWKKMFLPRTKKYLKEVRARNNSGKPSLNDEPQAQNQAIKEILN